MSGLPGIQSKDKFFLRDKREKDMAAHREYAKKTLVIGDFKKQFPFKDGRVRIRIHGNRGCGKSTIGALVKLYLEALGFPVVVGPTSLSAFPPPNVDSRELTKTEIVIEEK